MSRVYNVLTGAGRASETANLDDTPNDDAPDEEIWESEEETPFVEIGGPGGPIFSASPNQPAITTRPIAEAKPEPKVETARAYPRLVSAPATPAYLSVRFHDITVRPTPLTPDCADSSLVALHFPDHPVSGEYRVLRDEIRKQHTEAGSRVLLFTSAVPEAGTTTVLLNLAVTLAHEGKARVLIVDGNVNRPAVAMKLALKPAPGLCEVLAQRAPMAWAVQPSGVGNLQVLAAGDATDATAVALGRDLPKLLAQLRQWYDWVLVDSGVWGAMPERDAACPSADAVYLVTREANAERPEFTSLRGWVKELGGLLRGYVATRV